MIGSSSLRFLVSMLLLAIAAALLPGCASRPERTSRDRSEWERQLEAENRKLAPDVDAVEFDWHDGARQRTIPVRVYLPQPPAIGAGEAGRRPLIVFSHGLGGTRNGYSNLGRYWASQGFIAMHLQHPGSDRGIFGGSRGLSAIPQAWAAATPEQAIARALDVRFSIDRILVEPTLAARIDGHRIAIAGHSFGANTALLAAGARFQNRGTGPESYGDARIKAAIILSPPSLPSEFDPVYVYNPIAIPTLHLTGTDDTTPIPGLVTNPPDRRVPFDTIVARPRFLGIYAGGRHTMFNDWSRDESSQQIKASTRALTAAFLRATLLDDAQAMRQLTDSVAATGPLAAWEKY